MTRGLARQAAAAGLALVLLFCMHSLAASETAAEVTTASDPGTGTNTHWTVPSDPFTIRQTVYLNLGGRKSKPYKLRFPRMPPLPRGVNTYLRLNVTDTCGLFTLFHTIRQAAGAGVPPHIHYAEDEYFIFAGTGSTRLFTSQKATSLKPGRLPGFNIPPIEIGSTVLNGTRIGNRYGGSLVLSPAGNVHYFERVTDVTDVFTVYLDGFADADIINYVLYGNPTPRELLLFSGLYGIPTDMTGTFVKGYNDSTGTKQLYRNARGPIDVPNSLDAARRLQQLFDYIEDRGCCKVCV